MGGMDEFPACCLMEQGLPGDVVKGTSVSAQIPWLLSGPAVLRPCERQPSISLHALNAPCDDFKDCWFNIVDSFRGRVVVQEAP